MTLKKLLLNRQVLKKTQISYKKSVKNAVVIEHERSELRATAAPRKISLN